MLARAGRRLRAPHDRQGRPARCAGGRVRRYSGRRNVVGLSGAAAQGGAARAGGAVQASQPAPPHRAPARRARHRHEMNRRTIARPVSLEGIGLHLGAACRLTFHPARERARASSFGEPISPGRRRFRRSPSTRCSPSGTRSSAKIRSPCTRWSTCSRRSRAAGSMTSRSSSTARSRRSWTAARRRSSTRSCRPGIVEQPGEVQYLTLRAPMTLRGRRVDVRGDAVAATRAGRHDRLSAPADRAAAVLATASRAERFAQELGAGADVRIRARGRSAAGDGADPGRVARQRRRARRARRCVGTRRCAGPTSSCGTRRWIVVGDLALAGARVRARIIAHQAESPRNGSTGARDASRRSRRRRR